MTKLILLSFALSTSTEPINLYNGIGRDFLFALIGPLAQILIAVLGGLVIAGIRRLLKETNIELSAAANEDLENLVTTLVVATNQTLVKTLKEKNPNNRLTEDDKERVFNFVKNEVLNQLTKKDLKILGKQYADVEKYVSHLIEYTVKNEKDRAKEEVRPLPSKEEHVVEIEE